jgi:DNA ligase-1
VTLFADVVATSAAVGATRSRTAKLEALAALIGALEPDEVVPVVAMLSGGARQGRIGVGWATVAAAETEPAAEATLTVADVDAAVEQLAALTGPGSAGERTRQLTELFARATGDEGDWLRRLFGGEIRQGALEGLVTDAVARAYNIPLASVRRAAMLAGDLPAVARLAHDGGDDALAAIGLSVLRPVSPMLAATATDVSEALASTGPASVEWKLDGARIQAHRSGPTVRLFTRNLNEVTDRLPGIVELVRSFACDEVVLDGEAVGADTERFQEMMSRFGSQAADAGAGLVARFFDVLHVDGRDLLDTELSERLAVLDDVAGEAAMPRIHTHDPHEAEEFLADALAVGHEGVMVKALDSPYIAGRRGGSWRKVKPVRTLDLVVLAAEWGHGRREGWLSNLHLGARDEARGGFVMVGKTFKGLTDALLTWQTEALLAREVRRTRGTVWVRPDLVVEIALDGVQRSTRYPGGVALRFARVRRYREDKTAAEADTISTVQALL